MRRTRWIPRRSRPLVVVAALGSLALGAVRPAHAQSAGNTATTPASVTVDATGARKDPARVAMLDLAFYGKRANSLEPGDSLLADEGTAKVRFHLGDAQGVSLVDSAAVAAAAASPEAVEAAQGKPCNVIIACARTVGKILGVPWVVTGKVSKTSNLIWIFSGQLIDVATGKLVMDDEYELKGNAHDMVAAGSRAFARRVVRKVGGEPRT
jgi:hypothetical protein